MKKSFACVPSRRGGSEDPQHKLKKSQKRSQLSESKTELQVVPLRRTKRMVAPSVVVIDEPEITDVCQKVVSLMTKVEFKDPVPKFKGTDSPIDLRLPSLGFENIATKESQLLVDTMRGFFTDKHYRFRISAALDMSSGGTGLVNSTISCATIVSNTTFIALSGVFNEFFVERFEAVWKPVSRYNYPLTGVPATSVANLPLGEASLQHGQTAYTSLSAMTSNFAFRYHSTGDPFTAHWKNTERSSTPTLVTTTGTTQAWSSVGNAANYLGSLQFRTQTPPPALPVSQVLGTFATHWYVLFRVRV